MNGGGHIDGSVLLLVLIIVRQASTWRLFSVMLILAVTKQPWKSICLADRDLHPVYALD